MKTHSLVLKDYLELFTLYLDRHRFLRMSGEELMTSRRKDHSSSWKVFHSELARIEKIVTISLGNVNKLSYRKSRKTITSDLSMVLNGRDFQVHLSTWTLRTG
jgi:hypothetical protein